MEQSENKTALMNESMLQIQRLNNLWQKAAYHREKGYFSRYKNILEQVQDELYWDMLKLDNKDKATKNYEKLLDDIELKTTKAFLSGLIKTKYLDCLRKKERIIRAIQQESGKGSKYTDPNKNEEMD